MREPSDHASRNIVRRSVNADDGLHCVDVFERPGGGFGFEVYRRDAEGGGWYPVGYFGDKRFDTLAAAMQAARAAAPWLDE